MIKFKFFKVSSYIPLLFLVALGFSLLFFRLYPVRIFHSPMVSIGFGVLFFILGTILVIFSEFARHNMFSLHDEMTCNDFSTGVYKYSRHAGTFGFMLLFFGFGFFLNSMAVAIVGILHFILLSIVFIPLIERDIKKYCGDSYVEYCKNVRMWI